MNSKPSQTAATPTDRMADLGARVLLGTDRSGGQGSEDAAGRVLKETAVLGTRRRAGQRALQAPKPMAECPVESRPLVSAASAASLRLLLADPAADLIEEWAELAAARGLRVPDGLAPLLLDWWSRQTDDSSAIRAVLGERLDWLCSLNPAWRKRTAATIVPSDIDSTWQTGTVSERLDLLKAVRRLEPARAESLLRSTWGEDNADERKRFLERLEDGLSPTDEAFLEWVLDDRSKQTRAVASALLARLPGSQFVARMVTRAATMIHVEQAKKGILRRATESVAVEPPQEWDSSWERDGLEEKPPGGVGKRAWWLQQVLSVTPPRELSERIGLTSEKVIKAIAESDYAKHGIPGLCTGAGLNRDVEWCRALVKIALCDTKPDIELYRRLYGSLPRDGAEAVLSDLVSNPRLDWTERCEILFHAEHLWTPSFSGEVCRALAGKKKVTESELWRIGNALDRISRRIHPSEFDRFQKLITEACGGEPPPSVVRSIDRVRFRADMHREFVT